MIKKSVFESSETGRIETVFETLTARELDQRIETYERKYGMPLAGFREQFDCDNSLPWEGPDLMEWEVLVEELLQRTPPAHRN